MRGLLAMLCLFLLGSRVCIPLMAVTAMEVPKEEAEEEEQEQLSEEQRLAAAAAARGLVPVPVPGDGNCGIHSLAACLGLEGWDVAALREHLAHAVRALLEANPAAAYELDAMLQQVMVAIPEHGYTSVEELLVRLAEDGWWADAVTLGLAAAVFNVNLNVLVIGANGQPAWLRLGLQGLPGSADWPVISICWLRGNHFQPLLPGNADAAGQHAAAPTDEPAAAAAGSSGPPSAPPAGNSQLPGNAPAGGLHAVAPTNEPAAAAAAGSSGSPSAPPAVNSQSSTEPAERDLRSHDARFSAEADKIAATHPAFARAREAGFRFELSVPRNSGDDWGVRVLGRYTSRKLVTGRHKVFCKVADFMDARGLPGLLDPAEARAAMSAIKPPPRPDRQRPTDAATAQTPKRRALAACAPVATSTPTSARGRPGQATTKIAKAPPARARAPTTMATAPTCNAGALTTPTRNAINAPNAEANSDAINAPQANIPAANTNPVNATATANAPTANTSAPTAAGASPGAAAAGPAPPPSPLPSPPPSPPPSPHAPPAADDPQWLLMQLLLMLQLLLMQLVWRMMMPQWARKG